MRYMTKHTHTRTHACSKTHMHTRTHTNTKNPPTVFRVSTEHTVWLLWSRNKYLASKNLFYLSFMQSLFYLILIMWCKIHHIFCTENLGDFNIKLIEQILWKELKTATHFQHSAEQFPDYSTRWCLYTSYTVCACVYVRVYVRKTEKERYSK